MKSFKIILLVTAFAFSTAASAAPKWKDKGTKAVYDLIERVTPGYSSSFVLKLDSNQEPEYYSYSTSKDKILLEGNTTIALCVAYYQYLRQCCNVNLSFCGSHVELPGRLPLPQTVKGKINGPYRSFFHFTNEHQWPYNGFYDGWWGHSTLPKLNYEGSEKLEQYILDIGCKWVSPPFCADGWRLDVAADLGHSPEYNHTFWKKFRSAVKKANPEAIILAEHYGDPGSWLQGDEWDTVMNYDAFMEPLTWFFTGMEKHSDSYDEGLRGNADSFMDTMRYHMTSFMGPSLQVAMNELSNHDHSRFLTRTNQKVGRMDHFDYDAASDGIVPAIMREAVVLQMTWPGAPTIYYGDEAGVCGFTDPDNRRTYPWGHEDEKMLQFHKSAIHLHKTYKVFRSGSLIFLHGDYNVLAYARFDDREKIVVLFNNNAEEKEIDFRVRPAGIEDGTVLRSIFMTNESGYNESEVDFPVSFGRIRVHMSKHSSVVLKAIKETEGDLT